MGSTGGIAKDGQIHIAVDQTQKERWKEYVENSGEHESLTDLIRTSVERHISRDDDPVTDPSPAFSEDIQSLKDSVDRIRKDVSWLRARGQDSEDISGLSQEVFDELEQLPRPTAPLEIPPEVDDEDEYRREQAAIHLIAPENTEMAETEGSTKYTVGALADRLDVTKDRIEDAIEHLQDQFLPVVEVDYQGETHYFKEA